MNRTSKVASAAAAMAIGTTAFAQDQQAQDDMSYFIGHRTGMQMEQLGIDLNIDQLVEGLKDYAAGNESRVSEAQAQQIMQAVQAAQTAEAAAEGVAYLEENAAKEGVSSTESGLQYRVLTAGEGGDSPAATDSVTVHYEGKLIDGTVFDSSIARGSPATFGLNQVIPGWTEGVQLMSVGDTYEFTIPHELAYGPRGSGQTIPPFSTLVFKVELISIN